jgi:hypothetical protein
MDQGEGAEGKDEVSSGVCGGVGVVGESHSAEAKTWTQTEQDHKPRNQGGVHPGCVGYRSEKWHHQTQLERPTLQGTQDTHIPRNG